MFSSIGPMEIVVVLIIALLVFGPTKLPEVSRSIGRGLREFRKASQDVKDELIGGLDEVEPTHRPASPTAPANGSPPSETDASSSAGDASGSTAADQAS